MSCKVSKGFEHGIAHAHEITASTSRIFSNMARMDAGSSRLTLSVSVAQIRKTSCFFSESAFATSLPMVPVAPDNDNFHVTPFTFPTPLSSTIAVTPF